MDYKVYAEKTSTIRLFDADTITFNANEINDNNYQLNTTAITIPQTTSSSLLFNGKLTSTITSNTANNLNIATINNASLLNNNKYTIEKINGSIDLDGNNLTINNSNALNAQFTSLNVNKIIQNNKTIYANKIFDINGLDIDEYLYGDLSIKNNIISGDIVGNVKINDDMIINNNNLSVSKINTESLLSNNITITNSAITSTTPLSLHSFNYSNKFTTDNITLTSDTYTNTLEAITLNTIKSQSNDTIIDTAINVNEINTALLTLSNNYQLVLNDNKLKLITNDHTIFADSIDADDIEVVGDSEYISTNKLLINGTSIDENITTNIITLSDKLTTNSLAVSSLTVPNIITITPSTITADNICVGDSIYFNSIFVNEWLSCYNQTSYVSTIDYMYRTILNKRTQMMYYTPKTVLQTEIEIDSKNGNSISFGLPAYKGYEYTLKFTRDHVVSSTYFEERTPTMYPFFNWGISKITTLNDKHLRRANFSFPYSEAGGIDITDFTDIICQPVALELTNRMYLYVKTYSIVSSLVNPQTFESVEVPRTNKVLHPRPTSTANINTADFYAYNTFFRYDPSAIYKKPIDGETSESQILLKTFNAFVFQYLIQYDASTGILTATVDGITKISITLETGISKSSFYYGDKYFAIKKSDDTYYLFNAYSIFEFMMRI